MKRLLLKLSLFALLLLPIGCTEDNRYAEELSSRIEQSIPERLDDFSRVMVIPRRGCIGAIGQAIHEFRYNQQDDILYIFTYIFDIKGLTDDLQDTALLDKNHVLIDRENQFFLTGSIERNYPYCFDIVDGHLVNGKRFDLFDMP